MVALHNFLLILHKLFMYCFNAPRRICDIVNVLDTTATFSNKYIIFQINHKSHFTPVKDDCKQTIQVSSFA